MINPTKKIDLEDHYLQALHRIDGQDYPAAQTFLLDILRVQPDYEEAIRYLYLTITGTDPMNLATENASLKLQLEALKSKFFEQESKSGVLVGEFERLKRELANLKIEMRISEREEMNYQNEQVKYKAQEKLHRKYEKEQAKYKQRIEDYKKQLAAYQAKSYGSQSESTAAITDWFDHPIKLKYVIWTLSVALAISFYAFEIAKNSQSEQDRSSDKTSFCYFWPANT
jgi:hypothetical protein